MGQHLTSHFDGVHRKTLCVKQKIKTLFPEKVAVIFDGWSRGDTHYVDVFARFPTKNDL